MVKIMRFLPEGERLPLGWGLAWTDWDRRGLIIAPIPLNILLGLARRLYWRLAWGGWKTDEKKKAFSEGYAVGLWDGLRAGRR